MTIQDKQHWASKQPAKQDEVRDLIVSGVDWVLARKKESAIAAGAVVAAVLIAAFFIYARKARENEAWEKLSMAEAYAYYGRQNEALTALGEVAASGVPSAAGLASLMEAEVRLARGEKDQALSSYDKAAQEASSPLKPFASLQKVLALESAGRAADCAAAAKGLTDAHADHFLAPAALEVQGRCLLAAGKTEEAKAVFQRLSREHANSPWAARADARLQTALK